MKVVGSFYGTVPNAWGQPISHEETIHVQAAGGAANAPSADQFDALEVMVNAKASQADLAALTPFFDLPNTRMRVGSSNTLDVVNLRVLAEDPQPGDNLPKGLYFAEGTCSEQIDLIQDGRVMMTPNPGAAYRFGAEDDQTGGDRNQFDGLNMYSNMQLDQSGAQLPPAQQTTLNSVNLLTCREKPTIASGIPNQTPPPPHSASGRARTSGGA